MTDTPKRGRRGEGTIEFEHRDGQCKDARHHRGCVGRWRGVASITVEGKRQRYKVSAATKGEVADKLRAKVDELRAGVRPDGKLTVRQVVSDWLDDGLDGRSDKTRQTYREAVEPLLGVIGGKALANLTAQDVRRGLVAIADTRSTRSVQIAHNVLTRAIARAAAHDLVGRNVAALAERPVGKADGRPSRAMSRDVAKQLLGAAAAENTAVGAYTILSAHTGMRTEEARALLWSDVDLAEGVVSIVRSTRSHGRTKTPGSRRALELSGQAIEALKAWRQQQDTQREAARELWNETGLVFTTSTGTAIDGRDMRRRFVRLCTRANVGSKWTPRELRHTFVSILSEEGVSIEEIAHLAGHSTTRTTELVYRKELRPVIRTGAAVMGRIMAR